MTDLGGRPDQALHSKAAPRRQLTTPKSPPSRLGQLGGWASTDPMNPRLPRSLPAWFSVPVWLAALVTPTVYVLMVIAMDRLQVPAPPEGFVVSLFILIPILALLASLTVVWFSKMSLGWKVSGLALTALAMLIQCSLLVVVVVSAVSAGIAPVQ